MKTRVSKLWSTTVAGLLLAAPALARAQADDEDVVVQSNGPGGHRMLVLKGGPGPMPLGPLPAAANGIPPHLVEKLGVPRDVAQKIKDLSFESNEALIPLEADLKRAQLRLERLLSAPTPDERAILTQSDEVGRAETAVRRNRLSLMVQIKKLLGPDLWQKLEAEMGPMRVEKRIEIHRGAPGEEGDARPGTPPPPRKP
ncbi:periplasmic heavy metal sensor [Pyxidicoccus caerfyrddinensis]|uniref:periplasmic heavy metal sensor n=1 Tax=Pyxidicoccus caerfyrddinensis TaxID=2709663 RepID=UPI0013DABBA3|nr:periplasmic heavy metal sensor [Pyxidicoccus caerfyrddinensis]